MLSVILITEVVTEVVRLGLVKNGKMKATGK